MRSPGSNEALLGVLILLAIVSLISKAIIGTSVSVPLAGSVQKRLVSTLQAQGFATEEHHRQIQSSIIFARRGECKLSVRDASQGAATEAAFADDARTIGRVRYLYRGGVYASPPTLRVHLASTTGALLHAVGLKVTLHIPLALATSPGCRDADYGLFDLQVPSSNGH